jgi:hypothetical protein
MLRQWLQEFKQDVFSCGSFSLMDDDDLVLKPVVIDELCSGPLTDEPHSAAPSPNGRWTLWGGWPLSSPTRVPGRKSAPR